MLRKKNSKRNTMREQEVSQEVAQEQPQMNATLTAHRKITSRLDGIFCDYNYNFDNEFIKWVLSEQLDFVDPAITRTAVTTPPAVKIMKASELADIPVKLASDYIQPVAQNDENSEELIIL